mmetsp:Transcript_76109/g.232901  ORF Transcript_76109/g.232901 Transcript_76109/m.232901 type:complete len:238 (-) Transcript_76109:208-921(-)
MPLQEGADAGERVLRRLGPPEAGPDPEGVRRGVQPGLDGHALAREGRLHRPDVPGRRLAPPGVHQHGRAPPEQFWPHARRARERVVGIDGPAAATGMHLHAKLAARVCPMEAQIQPRRYANTRRRLRFLELRDPGHQGEGQVAAQGIPSDCHSRRRELLQGPPPGCQRVLQAREETHLWGPAVRHRYDARLGPGGQAAEKLSVRVDAEEPMLAAVEVQDDSRAVSARRDCLDPFEFA